MKWINGACNIIMLSFSCLFAAMAFCEQYIFNIENYISVLSKILCISMNLIPPALAFIVLLSIVYGYVTNIYIYIYYFYLVLFYYFFNFLK